MTTISPHVTVWRNNKGRDINAARAMDLAELERVIRAGGAKPNKDDLPLLKMARFGDVRTPNRALRHDANIVAVYGVEGDYDGERLPMEHAAEMLAKHGVATILYESPSATAERHRWRVLVPMSAPLEGTTEQLRQQHQHWVGVLNALLGGVLSGESFTLSQSYYFGRVEGTPERELIRLEGGCLDELDEIPAPIIKETKVNGHAGTGAGHSATLEGLATGEHIYNNTRDYAARLIAKGLTPEETLDLLRGYLIAHKGAWEADRKQIERWQEVWEKLPRMIEGGAEKFTPDLAIEKRKAAPIDDRETLLAELQRLSLPSLESIRRADTPAKVPVFAEFLYPGAWLIVGRPKIGKSWLLLQMTLAAAEGGQVLGYVATAAIEVLYVAAEDDDARIKSRLEALGVANAPAGVHVINFQMLRALAGKYADGLTFIEFLATWLDQHPKVRLVLLDTETTCRQIWAAEMQDSGTSRITETDYRQTRDFDDLALRRQIVIGLVNHAAKRKGEWVDIHELINRSNTALAGCSGSIALADPPDVDQLQSENRMRVLGIRGRDLKDDILIAVRQREEMPYFENLGAYQEVRQSEAEAEILEALKELMQDTPADGYVTNADLAEALSKKQGTVKRAISRMLKANRTRWKKYRLAVKRGKGGGVRLEAIA